MGLIGWTLPAKLIRTTWLRRWIGRRALSEIVERHAVEAEGGYKREPWSELRGGRMRGPGVGEAYEVARLAFELTAAVRKLRLAPVWGQAGLASAAGMLTQSRVVRFEVTGTVQTLPVAEPDRRGVGS